MLLLNDELTLKNGSPALPLGTNKVSSRALVLCTSVGFKKEAEHGNIKIAGQYLEAIGWVASPTGYSGDDIRDLMLESVGKRFGDQLPVTPVQWLSDNGSAHTTEQTRLFARQIAL